MSNHEVPSRSNEERNVNGESIIICVVFSAFVVFRTENKRRASSSLVPVGVLLATLFGRAETTQPT